MKNISQIIALRSLYDGAGREVIVKLFQPAASVTHKDEFHCHYEIVYAENSHHGKSIGCDSMQSILLSLFNISSYLDYLNQEKGADLSWLGMKDFDLMRVAAVLDNDDRCNVPK